MSSPAPSPHHPDQDPTLIPQNPNPIAPDDQHLPPDNPEPESHPHPPSPKTLTLNSQPPPVTDTHPESDPPQILLEDDSIPEDSDPVLSPSPRTRDLTKTASTAGAPRRGGLKGKKAAVKRRAFEKKCQQKLELLLKSFKPIPFTPAKTLDFCRHEGLLHRLGLWDFVHLDFDRDLRTDLIAQLVATFSKGERCSYVNGVKIMVNRADLARALKLPIKRKERVGLESAGETTEIGESTSFLLDLMSNWLLLHDDDAWIWPPELLNWSKLIREGSFEKVDWAGMVWFMVEKELMQAPALENSYYASHLQCLIRSQREELLSTEVVDVNAEEVDVKDEEEEGVVNGDAKMSELEEQSLELSLGQENVDNKDDFDGKEDASVELGLGLDEKLEGEKEGNCKLSLGHEEKVDAEMQDKTEIHMEEEEGDGKQNDDKKEAGLDTVMDSEECNEDEEEDQGRQWLLEGKTTRGEHFLQRCGSGNVGEMRFDENKKEGAEVEEVPEEQERDEVEEEDEEEEEEDEEEQQEHEGFHVHVSPKFGDLGRLPSSNFLQVLESAEIPFSSATQIHDNSCGEFLAARVESHMGPGASSIFENVNKREIDQDNDLLHHQLNGGNKRMRTDDSWDSKSLDFNMCVEQVQHWVEKARMVHEAREQMHAESSMSQQFFLAELQRRDAFIEHLEKTRAEDMNKKKMEIYRLERELYMMANALDGYRKALKATHRAFAEYRARCPQFDEPLYKDVPGSGGLVLSTAELERQRVKQEEEEKMKLLSLTEKVKDFERMWGARFEMHLEGINLLDGRLQAIDKQVKQVKDLRVNRKVTEATDTPAPMDE